MTTRLFFTAFLLSAFACEGRRVEVFEVSQAGGASAGTMASAGMTASGGGTMPSGGATSSAGATDGGSAEDAGAGTLPFGGSAQGGGGGVSGAPAVTHCRDDRDCSSGLACDRAGCSDMGSCVPWPGVCEGGLEPVCGCDGVTYWNDCLRLQSHVGFSAPGPCRADAHLCEVGADCGIPDASCSHLQPPMEMCGRGVGACWVLPPTCDGGRDGPRWRECKTPDGVPPGCVDTCTAISSERSYTEVHRGEPCN